MGKQDAPVSQSAAKLTLALIRGVWLFSGHFATGTIIFSVCCKISARWFVGLPVAFFLRVGRQFGALAIA